MTKSPQKICIVTAGLNNEYSQYNIDNLSFALVNFLLSKKLNVTILVTNNNGLNKGLHYYLNLGYNIELIDTTPFHNWHPPYLHRSKAVFEYFMQSTTSFDIVLFHERDHDGYLCLRCASYMPCFQKTQIGLICYDSLQWYLESIKSPITHNVAFSVDLERTSLKFADFIVIPSNYMLSWFLEKGWSLPEKKYIIPHIYSDTVAKCSFPTKKPIPVCDITQIYIISEYTRKSDLIPFIREICSLPYEYFLNKEIIIFSKCENISEQDINPDNSVGKNLFSLMKWESNFKNVEHICNGSHSRLIVLLNINESTPRLLLLCLTSKTPFICCNSNGCSEAIDEIFHHSCLFLPKPSSFKRKMLQFFSMIYYSIPNPSQYIRDREKRINDLINSIELKPREYLAQSYQNSSPLVSVIIPTYNRPELLPLAVKSVIEQKYKNIEVIIVNDGSTDPKVQEIIDEFVNQFSCIRSINTEDVYLGAARNAGIRVSKGEYLVFLDDDNILFPEYVNTCLDILRKDNAKCVLPAMERFIPDYPDKTHFWFSAGGGNSSDFLVTSTLLENHYGDACMFIDRNVFLRHAFPEVYKGAYEDLAFLMDLHLSGIRMVPYPRPLFYYRVSTNSMWHTIPPYDGFRVISKTLEKHGRYDLIMLAELYYFYRNRQFYKNEKKSNESLVFIKMMKNINILKPTLRWFFKLTSKSKN